jgi:MurNAc alpha-1-phosphate uridylyltransferase
MVRRARAAAAQDGAAAMSGTVRMRAMVLAAGRGERLRPLTDETPKPLLVIDGATMLDRMLDSLARAGVGRAVVNTHHLADRVEARLAARSEPEIVVSRENRSLGTGGGVAKALPHLGEGAFVVANGDVVLLDGVEPALLRLARAWRDEAMDALLLLHRTVRAFGYEGRGDYTVGPNGRLRRRSEREIAPYVFAGVQVLHARLFAGCPAGVFSLTLLYDRAEDAGRLYGIVHDGEWLHIGTPQALAAADRHLDEIG